MKVAQDTRIQNLTARTDTVILETTRGLNPWLISLEIGFTISHFLDAFLSCVARAIAHIFSGQLYAPQ